MAEDKAHSKLKASLYMAEVQKFFFPFESELQVWEAHLSRCWKASSAQVLADCPNSVTPLISLFTSADDECLFAFPPPTIRAIIIMNELLCCYPSPYLKKSALHNVCDFFSFFFSLPLPHFEFIFLIIKKRLFICLCRNFFASSPRLFLFSRFFAVETVFCCSLCSGCYVIGKMRIIKKRREGREGEVQAPTRLFKYLTPAVGEGKREREVIMPRY